MGLLARIFGIKPAPDFKELKAQGAQIVDVRTKGEFASGHLKGSKNIPLDQLSSKLKTLNKDKPVITCCASGMRSASAKGILKQNGFSEVYNGGGWANLQRKLS